ncbi:hybrid sensor histidine kinase/response regulator [Oxynema sp. CENA135]|uniref:hybrid sensor histidine kinase/response regulator n=1 Tax=Oxynema sp. CENA135 TaxID=984206 RepID=UPI00190B8573|nr:hybrid sensor histidine kinase/response regulator [Oxynema sp. CENA135]MBK4729996.1 hybrid sensor histidine kinase/response regulator [Oxynema sp. CENA135]
MTPLDPEDFNELLGAFIAETQEFLQLLESQLLSMEEATTKEAREQQVKDLFRAAHSIKGSALMFGFEELSSAAHALEDCFAILRDRADLSELPPETITMLLQGVDALKQMSERATQQAQTTGTTSLPDEPSQEARAIEAIKDQMIETFRVADLDATEATPPWLQNNSGNRSAIRIIFEQELPPIFNRLETELSQAKSDSLEETINILNEIYYQLSGLAGMLQIPEFGQIADHLRALVDTPNLSLEQLQQFGWAIAQNLQSARDQVLQERSISIQPLDLSPLATAAAPDPVEADSTPDSSSASETPPERSSEGSATIPEAPPEPTPEATATPHETANPGSGGATVVRPSIRVELDRLTELVNLVGELVINRTNLELQSNQLRGEVKRLRRSIRDLNQFGVQLREEYDRLAGHRGPIIPLGDAREAYPNENRTSDHDFDELELDEYTEFHTTAQEAIETTQAIAHSASQIDEVTLKLDSSTDHLRRICDRLRSRVMQLRVVSFSRAVDHLPRALRDLSRTYSKEVNLLLLGRETKIDESLLHALRDPLVHLVRNAFDHGIESPQERKAVGKPPSGQIEIEARHQGGQTIITITDDGKGIDPDGIRRRAVELGLVAPEHAQDLSLVDLYDFLFWPGFSTIERVGELSGRGVGLDIVRTNLRQVRGTVKVDSRLGRGTTFTIKLPLMLSIADALMVRSDRHILAVPLDAVEEILHVADTSSPSGRERTTETEYAVQMLGHQPMLRWREEYIRLVPLQQLLHYQDTTIDCPSPIPVGLEYIPVLVLTSSEGIVALAVERLLGQQEIVVKPLPLPLSKPPGILGCTILGDGQVVSILDVDDLIANVRPQVSPSAGTAMVRMHSGVEGNRDRRAAIASGEGDVPFLLPPSRSQPQILVVDDSYTIRQMLSLTLKRARYRVAQAKDGQDALEQLQSGRDCALAIVDIEMPRLDGFELLRALKADPQLARIPVAMLTSRSGAKHRQMAMDLGAVQYFTKPYNEPQLLSAIAQLVGG